MKPVDDLFGNQGGVAAGSVADNWIEPEPVLYMILALSLIVSRLSMQGKRGDGVSG